MELSGLSRLMSGKMRCSTDRQSQPDRVNDSEHLPTMADEATAALEAELEALGAKLASQKSSIRQLKADGSAASVVTAEVVKMKALQASMAALQAQVEGPAFDKERLDTVLRRRMIIVPSFEIHGGSQGLWDFGPVGCALKDNVIDAWKKHFVLKERMLQVESTNLTPEKVLETSGHVSRFVDLMCRDHESGFHYRADKLLEDHIENLIKESPGMPKAEKAELELVYRQADAYSAEELGRLVNERFGITAPDTGNVLSAPFPFNLMFSTTLGPGTGSRGFLRPETAQGIFVNFKRLLEFNAGKTPFAAAQVGTGFRNEITPRNQLVRVREFTMMEIEHFVHPDEKEHPRFADVAAVRLNLFPARNQLETGKLLKATAGEAVADGTINNETLAYFMVRTHLFLEKVGVDLERVRFRQHLPTEMAHYACDCWDAEIKLSSGWTECVGHADRACYDLKVHAEATGENMQVSRSVDPPRTVAFAKVKADRKVMGKTFKKDAALVLKALDDIPVDEACAVGAKLEAGEPAEVLAADGRAFTLQPGMLTVKKDTKVEHTEKFYCSVIEPSFGCGRILTAILEHCFYVREGEDDRDVEAGAVKRSVFMFPPAIAPVKCAVLPLLHQKEMEDLADKISDDLVERGVYSNADRSATAIGRKYARVDEIGVPFAVTIDSQTMTDGSITLRERDSQQQVRVPSLDALVDLVPRLSSGAAVWSAVVEQYGLVTAAADADADAAAAAAE